MDYALFALAQRRSCGKSFEEWNQKNAKRMENYSAKQALKKKELRHALWKKVPPVQLQVHHDMLSQPEQVNAEPVIDSATVSIGTQTSKKRKFEDAKPRSKTKQVNDGCHL